MLFRFLLVILGLFFSVKLRAQFKISGKIVEEKNCVNPFVSVKIIDFKNKVNYTQSDSSGVYLFKNLEAGKYSLIFSSLNFETQQISFYLGQDTLINAELKAGTNKLKDIQVSSSKPLIEKKIDRTVFNAENSVAAMGTDALELLAKIPGVRVLNDQVSLVGKGNVSIMVNDKIIQLSSDDLTNYLKSISSDNISKIEVIANPPAKYDAQGNNGLINIVLKKVTAKGFKGSINSTFAQATYPTASAGGNLSYRKDKISLYTNLNVRKGSLVPFEQIDVFYPTQTWKIVNKDRNFRTVPGGIIGLDYQVSRKAFIGISYNGGITNFHSEENIKTKIFNADQQLDSILNSDANAKINSHYNAANLYLKQAFDTTGKQITISADWFKFGDDKSRYFNNTSYAEDGAISLNTFAEYLSASKQAIDLYTLKADLDLPFKTFKLSLGTKLSLIQNESDLAFYQKRNDIYQEDLAQTNLFNYKENTQALYINLNKTIKKWDFQIGLRAEYTQIHGKSINERNQNDYFQLFPTFYAAYRAGENSNWGINYGRRINRPAYRKLNPFRWYSNQYAYAEGNPFLQPSYNNNIEISHVYRDIFTTSVSFSNTTNGFNEVNFIAVNTNVQVSKPVNFITGYNYQLSNSVVLKPLKEWESTNQFDVFYNVSNSSIVQTLDNLKGFGAYFSTVNQLTLNKSKTIMGDVNFWYQFPTVDGLNNNRSQCNLDLGLKTLLFNKKLQMAVNATDLLKTNQYRFNSLVNNIRQEYNNYYDSRQLRITIRYIFGNQKIKQTDRKAGNEEERKRNN